MSAIRYEEDLKEQAEAKLKEHQEKAAAIFRDLTTQLKEALEAQLKHAKAVDEAQDKIKELNDKLL